MSDDQDNLTLMTVRSLGDPFTVTEFLIKQGIRETKHHTQPHVSFACEP